MSCGAKVDLDICQGKTFSKIFRWGQSRKEYRLITAATQAAPCVITLASAPTNLPAGWVYQIEDAQGMRELNTKGALKAVNPDGSVSDDTFIPAVIISTTQLEINDLNALNLGPYTTNTGVLSYYLPVDLTGYTARMQVRQDTTSTTTLLDLNTTNGGIIIDTVNSTITVQATATATAGLPVADGVYDLELVSSGGLVYLVAYGDVSIGPEVTR